ncbi:MAG TPA: ATP-binding protein [Saprospiraceae bacterium]|nr:ATP-binding protein [Saprospiraceae bacterium]
MTRLKKSFVPKARLIQILGEYLIKDATVGLLELIKNSYDADALSVDIEMYDLNKPNAKILIRDNGTGMDENVFLTKWMNPATGHKEKQKVEMQRTMLGRLPLGEKGVGRFATQQIGDKLKMTSKIKESTKELIVDVDWRLFEDFEKNLVEVDIEYTYIEAIDFKKDKSGTILEITNLKSKWTEADIRRVSNTLKRMKSPFKGANNFDVTLSFFDCPSEFEKYADLELTDVLERAHYKIFGLIDNSGSMEFEYDFNVPGFPKIHRDGKIDLVKSFKLDLDQNLLCGGFIINLHHYNKKNPEKWLEKSGVNIKDVDELSGVSIYRDGIRVLPYGEKGDDWLKLDNRRIQKSDAIGNDTVIGLVEINQNENNQLRDKTNREGLIENAAYYQFEKLVLCTIRVLENERDQDKPKKRKPEAKPEIEVEKRIEDAKAKISDVVSKVSVSSDENIKQSAEELKEVETQFDEIKKQFTQTVEDFENVNKTLFNLAGTGLAAERFTHEFSRLVAGANSSLDRLKKRIDLSNAKIKREVDTISSALEALRNDIRLLGPMFYIKKVAKEKELDIRQVIDNTLLLQDNPIIKGNILVGVSGESFKVLMREGSCMQIFNNLIDNAIYWLSRKSEEDDKKLEIIIDYKTYSVFVSDSGPGVVSRYKDKIFEPFFTMKGEEGRGLGLYIIKEILEEKNWDIMLVNQDDYPGLLKGATFRVIFSDNSK